MRYMEYLRSVGEFTGRLDYRNVNFMSSPPVFGDGVYKHAAYSAETEEYIRIGWSTYYNARMYGFGKILLDRLLQLLGNRPIVIKADLCAYFEIASSSGNDLYIDFVRLIKPIGWDSTLDSRYRTSTELWYMDAYAPWPGYDAYAVESEGADPYTPFSEWHGPVVVSDVGSPAIVTDITSELEWSLLRGKDMEFVVLEKISEEWHANEDVHVLWGKDPARAPYMRILYLLQVEFFGADPTTGDMDLSDFKSSSAGADYYLGAIGKNETGTPIKGWLMNFGDSSIGIVELYDDHPEFTDPIPASGNTGSGSLSYVSVVSSAVSQEYTVEMLTATTFEVMGIAYRDNSDNLHPTKDGTASWQGVIGLDWTAPSGGLSIPARAWCKGMDTGDTFTFYVLGNSSDTTWPADSAQQIYITYDDSNSPDTSGWRRIDGRRTKSTASVTIDATTKKIPVRAITPLLWIVGSPAFIATTTDIAEGKVKSAGAASAGSPSFTGTGTDDLYVQDHYHGNWFGTIRVEIDGTGTPNTFKWSKDGGLSWEDTGVDCVAGSNDSIELTDGVFIYFGSTTGHTSGDYWDIDVTPFYVELEGLSITNATYDAGSRVGTTLPLTDVAAASWALATSDFGASSAQPDQVPIDSNDVSKFSASDKVFIQDSGNTDRSEYAVISSVGSNYLDLTGDLVYDYSERAMVTKVGSGGVAFWFQARSLAVTDEEQKMARINARL